MSSSRNTFVKMATSMWKTTVFFSQKLPRFLRLSGVHRFSSSVDTSLETSEVEYPPILPTGDELHYLNVMKTIKSAPTVPDMIYLLQKKQCWNYQIMPTCYHPNFLPIYKHATKTHMVEGLPNCVTKFVNSERIGELAVNIQDAVQDIALQEMAHSTRNCDTREEEFKEHVAKAKDLVETMVNYFLLTEIGQCPHILSGEFDYDVDVKSFWNREDKRYQYTGKPAYLLRTKDQLGEVKSIFE